ncbi:hypothetical protein FHG87_001472 [Trinorchestia longiramus]|nr:hypothetical protein FHG87_001472 [Trinorchestia longiramus]
MSSHHQLGRLVSESACEREDPGSNPAADMVNAARNTAWDLVSNMCFSLQSFHPEHFSSLATFSAYELFIVVMPSPPLHNIERKEDIWIALSGHKLSRKELSAKNSGTIDIRGRQFALRLAGELELTCRRHLFS